MMKFFKIITRLKVLIVFILIASNSLAQENMQSNNKLQKNQLQIVIAPFFKNDLDKKLHFAFNQGQFKLSDTAKISQNLKKELLKNSWFRLFIDELNQNIKSKKNLYYNLSENEINNFKNNNLNSDVILLHSGIDSRTATKINRNGNYTLHFTMAAYDLKSGELILRYEAKGKTKFENASPDFNATVDKLVEDTFTYFEKKLK